MTDLERYEIDVAVVGAGVIGLAAARAFAKAGREVIIFEAGDAIGNGISSRNSEVIHAGIYYATGSNKAELCVRGKELLYDYAFSHHVGHRRIGKLIVAAGPAQIETLEKLKAQADANGVNDLEWLDEAQARKLEPEVTCAGALLSPSTGIVDAHGLMLALRGDIESNGGAIAFRTPVARGEMVGERARLVTGGDQKAQIDARLIVNAAGHGAPVLLEKLRGFPAGFRRKGHFAKGNYFKLTGKNPFSRLIYPVPEQAGLGIHATLDLGGQVRFGPDVEWVAREDDLEVDPARAETFYAAIRTYWPGLPDGTLSPDYAGMRPKIVGEGSAPADFVIEGPESHGVANLINLLGIESPGLTSSLAIAERVRDLAD
jgi:L-2-hydroxyglutarate oxidase LhgO